MLLSSPAVAIDSPEPMIWHVAAHVMPGRASATYGEPERCCPAAVTLTESGPAAVGTHALVHRPVESGVVIHTYLTTVEDGLRGVKLASNSLQSSIWSLLPNESCDLIMNTEEIPAVKTIGASNVLETGFASAGRTVKKHGLPSISLDPEDVATNTLKVYRPARVV